MAEVETREDRYRAVRERFHASTEVQSLKKATEGIPSELQLVQHVKVDTGFLRLLRYLEAREAEAAGRPVQDLSTLLQEVLESALHDLLHEAIVMPETLPVYDDLWNRICDDLGYADVRTDAPEPEQPKDPDDIPF